MTITSNIFDSNLAFVGGDLAFYNISANLLDFDSNQHSNSKAYMGGGCIYIL